MDEITLTIDGKEIKAHNGDTVLEAAHRAGIEIPTLCAHPALEPYGGCRLCIVQIEAMRGLPPSCTTPATDGMVVHTKTDEIIETRREILKLMLSGHTSSCLVCSDRELCEKYSPRPFKTGKATRCTFCSNRDRCELRMVADQCDINDLDLPIIYKDLDLERYDPFMDRDYNLCILCGRCVRICEKIHKKGVIDFVNRGKDARVGTAFNRPHTESDCRFCGACIDICPTGTLTDRYAKWRGTPERTLDSTCPLCPHGCSIRLKIHEGKIIGSGMIDFSREARICAVGRFMLPQLLDNPSRILSHQLRVQDGLIKAAYRDALAKASEMLGAHPGERFALIAHEASSREDLYVMERFTREVMKSSNFAVARSDDHTLVIEPNSVLEKIQDGTVTALYSTGPFLDGGILKKLGCIILADMFPSEMQKEADVVFAVTAPTETEGSFLNGAGEVKHLVAASAPPEGVVADWKIPCDIAGSMGYGELEYPSVEDVNKQLNTRGIAEKVPKLPEPSPLDDVTAIPRFFRGHKISDVICAVKSLYPEDEMVTSEVELEEGPLPEEDSGRPFRILEKSEIVPNTHLIIVHAPVIAETCQPGQFVIAMVNEKSERIPYTISDFDREQGTITLVTLEVGRSSREMASTVTGQHLAHVTGPLGTPVEVKNYGTVLCAGGCYGVAAIYPIARAMKEAGNRVICVQEASNRFLLHWEEKVCAVSDEHIIVTKDGSAGIKGGIQDVVEMLVEKGERIDQSYIIGCTFMMMLVTEVTKKFGIPTLTAMNPIMVDGTGMCGACRVSVGDTTKFACVDGPFLDGLKINWIELMQRQAAFTYEEVEALPLEPQQYQVQGHECLCHQP